MAPKSAKRRTAKSQATPPKPVGYKVQPPVFRKWTDLLVLAICVVAWLMPTIIGLYQGFTHMPLRIGFDAAVFLGAGAIMLIHRRGILKRMILPLGGFLILAYEAGKYLDTTYNITENHLAGGTLLDFGWGVAAGFMLHRYIWPAEAAAADEARAQARAQKKTKS